jgi:phosphoribosylformimino-5-aminoimidazole carboxamide ribotide isomerase
MTSERVARPFELIPAIDLRGGRVVRLEQGDFARETVFADEPVAAARAFVDAGARWLHVVDLDGARAGEPAHLAVVRDIADESGQQAAIETAGGIRSATSVDAALAAGARRVVFGTAALRDPGLVGDATQAHGEDAVAVAVDVRGGEAIGDAWRAGAAGEPATELVRRLADVGVTWFEVTAIDRDGLLGGPDLRLLEELVRLDRGRVIASGGIRNVADASAVRDLGCVGAIIGRALYDGSFDLRAAIDELGDAG